MKRIIHSYDLKAHNSPKIKRRTPLLKKNKKLKKITKKLGKLRQSLRNASKTNRLQIQSKIKKLNSETKRIQKHMKKHSFKKKLARIETEFKNEKLTWRQMTKQLGIKPYQDLEPTEAKLNSGAIVNSGKDFQDTYQNYWQNLCTKKPNETAAEKQREDHYKKYVERNINKNTDPLFNAKFTKFEIHKIIKNCAKNKSPGPPGHTYEFIKLMWDIDQGSILKCINYFFTNCMIPEDWCIGSISLLHKNGDKTDPSNYRPITLINAFWKIIMKPWIRELKPILKQTTY